jgi:tight adherence protein B
MSIIRNTVSAIQSKNETRQEIEANITGKISEQRIMSVVPLALIGYITVTSPGFLDPCYHNPAGIFIMTVSLTVYVIAFFIGKRIMHIEV